MSQIHPARVALANPPNSVRPRPGHAVWVAFVRYAVLIQALWIVVYGGCSWITACHATRVSLATPADAYIPLIPWTAAVYLSLGPMLWLSPFVLRSVNDLRVFAKGLAGLIILSAAGFLLLPADEPLSSSAVSEVAHPLFQVADRVNLRYNLFPSLHVSMAVFCAAAYSRFVTRPASAGFGLWAVAIAASTLLTRQHYTADVLAGALLGLAVAAASWARR
jgi:membrane-associated phospholipid phosphatase